MLRCAVLFCASLPAWLAAAVSPEMKPGIDLMARAIAADTPTIILGTIAKDDFWRVPETGFTASEGTYDDFPSILLSLNITRVYVQQVLRSEGPVPRIIYLQRPGTSGVITEGVRRVAPALSPDNRARLLFLLEPEKLSSGALAVGLQHSRAQQAIRENRQKLPPLELFKRLRIDPYIKKGSYFEPFAGQASFLIDEPGANLPPIVVPPAAEASLQERRILPPPAGSVLPMGFTKDVVRLLEDRERRTKEGSSGAKATPSPLNLQTEPGRWLREALEKVEGDAQ